MAKWMWGHWKVRECVVLASLVKGGCVCVLSEEQQLCVDLFKDPVGEINSGRSRVALPGLWVHFCHRGQRSTFSQKQSNDSVMTGLMFLCFGGVNVP